MRAVTISREYGSGGGEIAVRLAKHLGWRLIDHEVVAQVARRLGVSEAEAEVYDEHVDSLAERALSSLNVLASPVPAFPIAFATDSDEYDTARRAVVAAAVQAGQVVIVGRGAQALLADRRDALHVRIVAPLAARVAYVMQREGLNHGAAQARIQAKDRDRARFLATEHQHRPDDAHLYDLIVNTGVLDLDSVVDLLVRALERKAQRLATPADELGPGAGLGPYPQAPGNFAAAGGSGTPR
jgi:cytidylate kinase